MSAVVRWEGLGQGCVSVWRDENGSVCGVCGVCVEWGGEGEDQMNGPSSVSLNATVGSLSEAPGKKID